MLSHMSSMRKILPVLLCLAMLAGGAALYAPDAAAQAPAPEAPAPEAAAPAAAPEPPKIDTGDTAWVLVSTAWCWLMTAPGLALFYGGMARSKNALSTVMQSFVILCLISIQWVLWGYSLAFRARRRPHHWFAGMGRAQRGWRRAQCRLCVPPYRTRPSCSSR